MRVESSKRAQTKIPRNSSETVRDKKKNSRIRPFPGAKCPAETQIPGRQSTPEPTPIRAKTVTMEVQWRSGVSFPQTEACVLRQRGDNGMEGLMGFC